MAYQIDKFNGTFLVSIDDQTINTTATDLRLVGRNYAGYGEIQNENFLHLLENFANTAAPSRPIAGQIWFDSSTSVKKLKFYDGARWKAVNGPDTGAAAPAGSALGDFWFDTAEQQLYAWTGNQFVLIGPEKAPLYGETSAAPAVVKDSVGTDQQIIKFQVGSEVIAIVSKNNFTLSSVVNPITGFSQLKKGINFINSDMNTGATSSAHRFWGTAANSERLNGFSSEEFLRSANAIFTSQVSFKDNGFTVGDQNDLRVRILNGTEPIIESTLGKPFIFRISNGESNITDVMSVNSTSVIPGSTGVYDLGTLGAKWKTIHATEVKATTFYGNFVGSITSTDNTTPLSFNAVGITGSFNQTAANVNFNVNLTGTGVINLTSGTTGTVNNVNIGTGTRGTAAFTTLTTNNTATFTAGTASTLTTNGTIVVTGGVGISGAINVGGNSKFYGTGSLGVPVGTTAERPTGVLGAIRYNTTIGEWEGYDGFEWRPLGTLSDEDYGLVTGVSDVFVDYGGLL